MKKKNFASFLAGVLATLMVMGLAVPAIAASTTKTATLYYNDIKIRLNGKEIMPKDAGGNVVEPFVIDGTTYLPVRAISEALGLNVDWDGSTRTVILGNDPQYNQPAAWLGDLEPFAGKAYENKVTNQQYSDNSTANSGDTFDRYYRIGPDSDDGVSYLLKGEYKRLTGTFYLPKGDKDDTIDQRLLVYADDVLIYTSPTLTSGVMPIDLNVDISGCYELEIVHQYLSGENWRNSDGGFHTFLSNYSVGYYYIGNAALWTN